LERIRSDLMSESPSNLLNRGEFRLLEGSRSDSTKSHPALGKSAPTAAIIVTVGVSTKDQAAMTDLKRVLRRLRETCLLMVGIPDYDRYVEHMKIYHPERSAMTQEEFFWDRQKSRYADGKGRMRGGCS
jgi:uncharacterized short protein YbdD (DUF466 family)